MLSLQASTREVFGNTLWTEDRGLAVFPSFEGGQGGSFGWRRVSRRPGELWGWKAETPAHPLPHGAGGLDAPATSPHPPTCTSLTTGPFPGETDGPSAKTPMVTEQLMNLSQHWECLLHVSGSRSLRAWEMRIMRNRRRTTAGHREPPPRCWKKGIRRE